MPPGRQDGIDQTTKYSPWGSEAIEQTNARAFAEEHGLADVEELLERSWSEPEWFWDTVVDWLDLLFYEEYDLICNNESGPEFTRWYIGGQLNIAHNTVDRWADSDNEAIIWEGENGTTRSVTFDQLHTQSNRVANALTEREIGPGDTVGLYMPMLPETVAVMYGALKVGAIVVPLFSGFEHDALTTRVEQSGCSIFFTVDGYFRRGKERFLESIAATVAARSSSIEDIIVYERLGTNGERESHCTSWSTAIGSQPDEFPTVTVPSNQESMLLYSSGTTGRPKGTIQTHAGQLVKTAKDIHFDFDQRPSDLFFWMTDMGWIMGPWMCIGNHALGGTVFMYEGAPDYPTHDRCWRMIEEHEVTVFGTSPTAIRMLRQSEDHGVHEYDCSSLRILGSTGEPWDQETWKWFYDNVGERKCPIINVSGGTELGGHFLSPLPGQPLKPCTVGQPSLGIDVDIVDATGESVGKSGTRGYLVVKSSCPSMTKSLWEGDDRYLNEYWSRWEGIWDHGDWAERDSDDFWYIHGRADESVNVAGQKVGPGEIENVLLRMATVTEAAVIGVPDDLSGEAIVAYVVLDDSLEPTNPDKLREQVARTFGKPFRPREIEFVDDIPKNQSGKIQRKKLRHRYTQP